MRHNRKSTNILCAILLVSLAAALNSPALFTDKVLLPSDLLRFLMPWALELPYPEGVDNNDAIVSDSLYAQYPAQVYFKKSLEEGRLPLWNPYQSAGRPFAAVGQTQVFYPVAALLTKLAEPGDFFELFAFIHCAMAGVFMFLYMRGTGCGSAGSFIAGAGYTLTGWTVHWTMFPSLLGPAAWAPLFLLFADIAVRKRNLRYALLAGAVLGVDLLCGNPQLSAYIVIAATAAAAGIVLSRSAPGPFLKKAAFAAAALGLAVITGVALSAAQFFITCELLGQSSRAPIQWQAAGRLFSALPFFLPHVYGSTANGTWSMAGPAFLEGAAYAGAGVVLLACLALPLRRDSRSAAWTAVAFLGASAAIGAGFLRLNNYLPGLSKTHLARLVFLFPLAVPILAALAWDSIEKNPANARKTAIAAAFAAIAILVCSHHLWRGSLPAIGSPAGKAAALAARSFTQAAIVMLIIIAAMFAANRNRAAVGVLAAACVTADLFLCAWGFNPAGDPDILFPETPSLSFLKSQKPEICRMNAMHMAFRPNTATAHGLYDLRGYEPLGLRRYSQLVRAINLSSSVNTGWQAVVFPADISRPVMDMMNECFVVSLSQQDSAGLEEIYSGIVKIYRNLNAMPRAVLYTRWKVEKDAPRMLDKIVSSAFNPREELYLEREPGIKPGTSRGPAVIEKYEPERVEISAQSESGGVVFMSDAYETGWKASVDGRPAEIIPANHAFRAVAVGPGNHRILMTYQPRSLKAGFALSSAALIILLFATAGMARAAGGITKSA